MAEDNASLTKLWRVRKTVFQMLEDRGYVVAAKYKDETREKFQEDWDRIAEEGGGRERFAIQVQHKDDKEDKIIVYFPDENKRVGVKPVRVLAERMEEFKITKAIMVVRQPLTPFARTAIQETLGRMRIEVFHQNELVVNITKHDLVPKHQPMSDEDKQFLLDRYELKQSQLPRIQYNDPVARYFGLQKEQVVKIIRPSETAGRYVTYRLCV
eukprot:GEMP01098720.1.p1 GENE.GEMP01098720.1~~GEMP01098720.1.p1  ORF type:complete len:219 (+),score=39.23 GEMP01098720.1:23-658(+)